MTAALEVQRGHHSGHLLTTQKQTMNAVLEVSLRSEEP